MNIKELAADAGLRGDMTLRDVFAGRAMQVLKDSVWNFELLSKQAYEMADAMLGAVVEMNIKELAEQANGRFEQAWPGSVIWHWDELAKFALLIAAHECEECAKLFELTHKDSTVPPVHFSLSDTAKIIRARGKA